MRAGVWSFLLVPFAVESPAARMMPGMKSVHSQYLIDDSAISHCRGKKDITFGEVGDWLGLNARNIFICKQLCICKQRSCKCTFFKNPDGEGYLTEKFRQEEPQRKRLAIPQYLTSHDLQEEGARKEGEGCPQMLGGYRPCPAQPTSPCLQS